MKKYREYYGEITGKLRGITGEYPQEVIKNYEGNIRTRIVTKKLQILDKWELQEIKKKKWE